MISITNGSHHVPTTKSTLFTVSIDGWDTKEGHEEYIVGTAVW